MGKARADVEGAYFSDDTWQSAISACSGGGADSGNNRKGHTKKNRSHDG
jgi:hypothetical protein